MITDLSLGSTPGLYSGLPQSIANPLADELTRPWEEQQAAIRQERLKWRGEAVRNLDSAVLDWDNFSKGKPIDLNFDADPETARKRGIVNTYLTIENEGQPIGGGDLGPKMMRDQIAMERFNGRGVGDDMAFYGEIQKESQTRKDTSELFGDLTNQATKATLTGAVGEQAGTFQAWREEAMKKPGYKQGNDADYLEAWLENQEETKARIDPFRDELSAVWKAMKGGGAGSPSTMLKELLPFASVDGNDLVDEARKKDAGAVAFEAYETLSDDERSDFMAGIDSLVKALPKEERPAVLANLAKTGGRMVDDLGRGIKSRFTLKGLEEEMNRGVTESRGPFGASDADKQQAKGNADRIQADRLAQKNFMDDLRRIERDEYAPVRHFSKDSKDVFSMRTLEDGFYGIPGVAASVGTVMIPGVGPAAMYLAMEDFAYGDLRDNAKRSGMSDADASKFADDWKTAAAIPQTAIETLQTFAPMGKLPMVNKVLGAMGDQIKNRLIRGAVKAGAIGAAETVTEELQYLTPYAVQDIASAFAADTGTAEAVWKNGKDGAFDGFWTRQATTFISMFPMAAFGASGGLNAEARARAFREATPLQRRAFGFTEEANARMDAARGQSEINAAADFGMATRVPQSEQTKAAVAELEAEIAEKTAAAEEAQRSGIMPTFSRTTDGWSVRDGETGAEIGTAQSSADALRIATAHSSAIDETNTDQTAFLATMLQAGEITTQLDNENRQTGFEFAPGQKVTAAQEAAISPKDEARVLQQVAAKGNSGFAGIVLGKSVTEFKQKVRNTANKINAGGSVLTVFHEETHGHFREALNAGRLTKESTIETIRGLQASFVGKKNKAGEDVQFLPAEGEVSDVQLDEAVSELMETLVLKDRKKAGMPAGMVSKNLSAMARMGGGAKSFKAFVDTVQEFFGVVFSRAYELRKAIKEGKVKEADIESFTNKLFGLEMQDEHDAAAVEARDEILGEPSGNSGELESDPFSLGPARMADATATDAAYLAAVESGDMETAQRMVDEAAKAAGYSSEPVTHITPAEFSAFDRSFFASGDVEGFYFAGESGGSSWGEYTKGNRTIRAFLKMKNPAFREVESMRGNPEENRIELEREGFDGVVDDTYKGNQYIVFNPNQIKSADAVTYDNEGEVIPLSQRFNPDSDSISYSLGPARMADALADEAISRIKNPKARMAVMTRLADKMGDLKRDKDELGIAFGKTFIREAIESPRKADLRKKANAMKRELYRQYQTGPNDSAAMEQATAESEAWFEKYMARRDVDYSPKARLLRALAMLDGIISALPIAERGRIGGYAQLAKLGTDEARLEFLTGRIEKVDQVVEKWLSKEYGRMLDKLMDRAKPVKGKPGEKPKGKAGADVHSLFDVLREARGWSQDKTDQHVDGLLASIASGNLTPEAEAHATLEANLVGLVGNWDGKIAWKELFDKNGKPLLTANGQPRYEKVVIDPGADSVRRASAIDAATKVFEAGYAKFKLATLLKAEDREIRRKSLERDTGKTGDAGERDEKLLADNGLMGGWKDNLLSLVSFEQLTEYIFGRDSKEAVRIVDMERAAAARQEDAIQADMDALEDLFESIAGSPLEGEKLRWSLSQKSMKIGKRQLSPLEAITATLMWRQEDGRRHMLGHKDENGNYAGKWHYDQAFIDKIEAALSPEAQAVRAHIAEEYSKEWDQINPTFVELNGISLPKNPNYSPLTVKPQQASAGQMVDPVTGSTMSGASTTPGSLRSRGQAIAEPEFRDALQTFIAHRKQIQHWIAYAPFNAEAGTILRNRDLGNSIESRGGDQALTLMRGWMDFFAQGGTRDASAHLALNQTMNRISGRAAASVLIGRMGVLAIQTTQLGAAIAEMPIGSFAMRFGKLMTGNLGWGSALNSEYIQRRLSQMPVVVQQAMDGLKASKPNRLKYHVQKIGRLISGVDALMTAGTFAMVHDYQLKQAKSMGLSAAEAEAYALSAAERSVDRVAQPTRAGTRSYYENTASGPAMKVLWSFASESRQKLMLSLWRLGAKDRTLGEKARAVAVTWVVGGMVATIIRSAMRDIRDDDDDEVFDEKNWGLKRLTLSTLTGPFQGLPFIGDMIEGGVYGVAGEYLPEGNLISSIPKSLKAATRVSDWGEKKPEEIIRDIETILSGAALADPTGNSSAASSISHLARDLFSIIQNATD